MKFALGTVQFGLSYGLANQTGQVSLKCGAELLKQAWSAGINTLDTAIWDCFHYYIFPIFE